MTTTVNLDTDAIAQAGLADPEHHGVYNNAARGSVDVAAKDTTLQHESASLSDADSHPDKPTEEELRTLRRVSGKIKWAMWTIAFVELCERFSYYGSSVLYTNFVNRPLPAGSTTGAPLTTDGLPGALGMGPSAAQGISLFNQFFAYLMPLFGAWIADARMGRFWTIHLAIGISTIAHAILVASSAPGVIVRPDASFAAFIIGLITLCVGTGFFKANVSPLLAEQNEDTAMRVMTLKSGERVIVDPAITNTRVFLYFYFCINLGSLAGQISMVFVEQHDGFWLAFLIPTIMFLISPFVLWSQKKNYKLSPPTGSLLSKFFKLFFYVRKRSSGFKMNWAAGKPSGIAIADRPAWMTYDDAWVDEVRRGLMACKVFLFLPIFFLAYNQMTGNLTIQAGTMQRHGVPNDIIQNLNPISIVIMIPLIDHLLYPGLRKLGIAFTPIKRMTVGFMLAALSMVASAVMQHYIYQMSPCGEYANKSVIIDGEEAPCPPAEINVWAQSLPYILIGLAEIFANVTSYEYAFSKAPANMKSLVMSVNLFMSAISAALGEAFTPLSADPLLVWNYTAITIIAFIGGVAFWFCFRHLDSEEDKWNMLKKSEYIGQNQPGLAKDVEEPAPQPVTEIKEEKI
ncbi:oligopeptide transporter [Stachybotrys elegans]|uniref:Oligopeptide transporter n=1 Tax=Stachybotrys elegans TaxID=80388 RepID=A0A8K0WUM3_9HYPO|nr:oligopeptide transporter [Stachybotrys elegans]